MVTLQINGQRKVCELRQVPVAKQSFLQPVANIKTG
jgi:hypothetical protein